MGIQVCDSSGLKPLGDCLIKANKREAHVLQQEQWLNKIKCASWSILTAGSALSISGIVAPIATSMLVMGSLGVACCTGFKLMSACVERRGLSEKVQKSSMYEAVPSDMLQRIEGGVDRPSMERLAEYLDTSVERLKVTMDLLGANDAIRVIRPEPGSSKTASLSSLSRLERG